MKRIVLLFLNMLLIVSNPIISQSKIYWADNKIGKIFKSDLDGSNTTSILNENKPQFVIVDSVNSKIYWSDKGTGSVNSCNMDGSDVRVLIANLKSPKGICLSHKNDFFIIDDDKIIQYNTSGQFLKVIHENLINPIDIFEFNSKLYWGGADFKSKIEYSDLDGSKRKVLVPDVSFLIDIEIDPINKKLYYVESNLNAYKRNVFRVNLDGSQRNIFLKDNVKGFTIDSDSGYVYYTWKSMIYRKNISGEQKGVLIASEYSNDYIINSSKLAFDKKNKKLFFISDRPYFLSVINLEDKSVLNLLEKKVHNVGKFKIDTINSKIYWMNAGGYINKDEAAKIMRADLDGRNIEVLVKYPDIKHSGDLVLNIDDNEIFFSDKKDNTIKKMSLRDRKITPIIAGYFDCRTLSIDKKNKKLYWINSNYVRSSCRRRESSKIMRADFDGSNIEEVITADVIESDNIFVSSKQSKIFWSNRRGGTINIADLDGNNYKEIYKGSNGNYIFLYFDEKDEKLYSSFFFSHKIQRSNLDGSNVEELSMKSEGPKDIMILHK